MWALALLVAPLALLSHALRWPWRRVRAWFARIQPEPIVAIVILVTAASLAIQCALLVHVAEREACRGECGREGE